MSELKIPAGLSLREVAERLGVPLDELQRHAGGLDVEAPAPAEVRIEVPDGFLREADRSRRAQYAAVPVTSARHRGANEVVTLGIEYRRTRVEGGIHRRAPSQEERDGLAEAEQTLGRLEADANDLAVDLFRQLTQSRAVAIRGPAYAGQAIAESRRYLLYGEDDGAPRLRAMSAAKAALMADPKLPRAHLAIAAALWDLEGRGDRAELAACLDRAVALGPQEPAPWIALAEHQLRSGLLDAAEESITQGLEVGPEDPRVLEVAALTALGRRELERAEAFLGSAVQVRPGYANGWARLAGVLRSLGRAQEAEDASRKAIEAARTPSHRQLVEHLVDLSP